MPVELIYSDKFCGFSEQGHPDNPERLLSIISRLEKAGYSTCEPLPAKREDLLLAHTEQLLKMVEENRFFDPNTPNIKDIYRYALLSCGAAIQASQRCMECGIAVSLARPPGHHAGKNTLGGFCYFNNIAVASKKIHREKGIKIAVLDIDGHHGNGTEEILREEEETIYVSIHQYPAYPGTGAASFGNCYNFPVNPGISRKKYMEKFNSALEIINNFSPDMIGLSAGFDAHASDPLLQLPLIDEDYYHMGRELSRTGADIFAVLEGGYSISSIGNSAYCLISGLDSKKQKNNRA